MGTEKDLTAILVRQVSERRGITSAGLRMTGGTPNHKALARCVGYGWGLATPEDRDEGRGRVLEFLRDQEHGHMVFGRTSEFGTSSHFAWWQNALAGIWKLAERAGDEEVLEGVRGWWVRELSVEGLCSTPEGRVVIPGARTHAVSGYADQRAQRDVGRAVILQRGLDLKKGPGRDTAGMRIPRDVRAGRPSLDRVGLWLLHSQLPAAELRKVAMAPPEWPVLLDTLHVRRSQAGHVAWFDTFTGMCPSFFAWADYSMGAERYGARRDWRKNRPGGPRPADIAVPEAPGEVTETVVIQGRGLPMRGDLTPAPLLEEEPCSSGGPTGRDPSAQGNALGRVDGTASGKARGRSHEPSPMGWAEGTQAVGPEKQAQIELTFRGHEGSGASERRSSMDTKDTDTQDMLENAVNTGIAFEEPEIEAHEDDAHEDDVATLRRRPRTELEEILAVHDPEEPLKAERVQEALRAMPEWELTQEGQAITRVKELPAPEIASLYTAYVTGFAGFLGQPVTVSVSDGLAIVTLYAPLCGGCMGELTEPVLDFARQIG